MLMHVLYNTLAQEHSKQILQGKSCEESAQYTCNYVNLCFRRYSLTKLSDAQ